MHLEFLGPAYRIVTPRLVLRCWQPSDAEMLAAATNENIDHLRTFMVWADNYPQPIEQTIESLRKWRGSFDLGQDFPYGVFNREETRVLGGTGLHTWLGKNVREIGYWIHKDFTNRGLATELSAALTRVAFDVENVERVEIHCVVENVASAAVPRKLGYSLDGTLRQRISLLDNRLHDMMVWSLFREEYPGTPCAAAEMEAYDAISRRLV
jgi:RimJ/RimL family protein N-acetyltransferase